MWLNEGAVASSTSLKPSAKPGPMRPQVPGHDRHVVHVRLQHTLRPEMRRRPTDDRDRRQREGDRWQRAALADPRPDHKRAPRTDTHGNQCPLPEYSALIAATADHGSPNLHKTFHKKMWSNESKSARKPNNTAALRKRSAEARTMAASRRTTGE